MTLCARCANGIATRCRFLRSGLITAVPCVLDEIGARYEYFLRENTGASATLRLIPVFTVLECPDFVEGPPPPLAVTLPEYLAGRAVKAASAGKFRKGGLRMANIVAGGLYW